MQQDEPSEPPREPEQNRTDFGVKTERTGSNLGMRAVRFLDFAAFGGSARNDRGSLPLLEMTLGKGHATRASQ